MAITGTDIKYACKILSEGGLVAIPTETVYGLAGNALNPEAVARIFEVKNRPSFDPLIVHVPNIQEARRYSTEFPEKAELLASHFWPGPLTLLLPKNPEIPDIVTSGMPDVAIRVPDNKLTLELLTALPFPLVAPSANPFGYISPTTAQHVNDQLGDKIDYILDGGAARVGLESTIVGFPANQPTIYRLGGLSVDEIEKLTGHVEIMPHSSSNPKAPGMLKSHYAPAKPFRLESAVKDNVTDGNNGYLLFCDSIGSVPIENQRILAPDGNMKTAAKNLFKYMRELDALNVAQIIAELVPEEGLGRAINDRLRRAASDSQD
jgi:L-threonylcarbamoyladenylate synthase